MTSYEYNQLQDMLTNIRDRKPKNLSCKYQEGYETAILKMKSMIHSFYNVYKTADVEPVRYGKWTYNPNDGHPYAHCSACDRQMSPMFYGQPYCPKCGAKMPGNESRYWRVEAKSLEDNTK